MSSTEGSLNIFVGTEPPVVVGRPAYAVPPGSLPATALGEPVANVASTAIARGSSQACATQVSSSSQACSPCQDSSPEQCSRPGGAEVRIIANPPSPLAVHSDRSAFGTAYLPEPLFECTCLYLEKKDWHIVAVCSRVSFNALAVCQPLVGPNDRREPELELPEVSTEPVLQKGEGFILGILAFVVWVIIFFGGRKEWEHGIQRECGEDCADCGLADMSFVVTGCRLCKKGLYNGGMKCYKELEDLPPVKTGAALGGHFYYHAIIVVQVLGAMSEIILLARLRRRRQIIGKEMCVALTALLVEILRMILVDLFLLRTYFYNHSYTILPIDKPVNGTASEFVIAWSHLNLGDIDTSQCSIFGRNSALLDYDESFGWGTGGHPRFRTIGWAIGGEFAMYYFLAAVINEVADNLFIIPATTLKYGFKCKVMSIILELFQLGALFPAAAFTHGRCLTYHNPLKADLSVIRYTIVTWGYFLWGSVFVIGIFTAVVIFMHLVVMQSCLYTMIADALEYSGVAAWCRCSRGEGGVFSKCRQRCAVLAAGCVKFVERLGASTLEMYVFVASVPLLITGTCLGILVCLGQASKSGFEQVLTAIVLLSDVLLKLGLFCAVEVTDEMLRREGAQKRAERARRLEEARMQLELGGGALAFPVWWQRRKAEGPSSGWRRRLWRLLHA
mmetsp:Transcript_37621/g.70293  ORF Transcript_37621/g.70293 Transcript_37621/m.70293 type:complete len:674 (-) Transcript_37621:70-2091(-)